MRFTKVALLSAALLTSPLSANAQDSAPADAAPAPKVDTTRNGDWETACQEVQRDNSTTKICEMRQVLVHKESGKEFVRLVIAYPPNGGKPVMRIFTPLGVLLQPGLQMQIDDAQPLRVAYAVCLPRPARCIVEGELEAELIALMKKGNTGKLTMVFPGNRSVAAPFSLQGFTKSINSLPK